MRIPLPLLIWLLASVAGVGVWRDAEMRAAPRPGFLVSRDYWRDPVVRVPRHAAAQEIEGAKLLSDTLAQALGRPPGFFAVGRETSARRSTPGIYVGRTQAAHALPSLPSTGPLDRSLAYVISDEAIVIRSGFPEDIVAAVGLFLEETVRARWFMPGEMGAEVSRDSSLRLAPRERVVEGAFKSRFLGGVDQGATGSLWFRLSRLNALLPHGHTADGITTPALLRLNPSFAPWLNGERYMPPEKGLRSWQPDLTAPGLAPYVAVVLAQRLRAEPQRAGVAFGLNDSFRFDQSERTVAAIAPLQYFRERPDYSDLLFKFLNEVAAPLAREFPDRYLTTYAYYWNENAPRVPVAANVMPFLTADRSMWCDPDFAANDRDLIQRWSKSGARFIGLYDYLYGAPFLVPRPTLWAVTEPIPYAYAQGARAYTAEMTPNWALDGPKPWLAAQLLWDPHQDSASLIGEYYARFWQEAALPMRAFYEDCDRQWREQPRPLVWVKYLRHDDQRRLFPPKVRARLRSHLEEATKAARTPKVRQRVRFVAEAFEVTEAFCRHDEVREELQRLSYASTPSTDALLRGYGRYTEAREELIRRFQNLKRTSPLAIQTANLDAYLDKDPRLHVVDLLAQRGELARLAPATLAPLFEARAPEMAALQSAGRELIADVDFRTLSIKAAHPFILTNWVERGKWQGKTEPTEHRRIELRRNPDGSQRLFYRGCMQEYLWQWLSAQPGHLYRASVRVKAKVSTGSSVLLTLPFLGTDHQHLFASTLERLPVGDWSEGVTMTVLLRAPQTARWVGVGVAVFGQLPGDYAEWEMLSLRDLGP